MRGQTDGVAKQISVLEAAQLVEEQGGVLLDVREPDEWSYVRAPGALHIPMRELSSSTDLLPAQRRSPASFTSVRARRSSPRRWSVRGTTPSTSPAAWRRGS